MRAAARGALFALAACFAAPAALALDTTLGGRPLVLPDPNGQVALKNPDSAYYKSFATLQQRRGNRLLAIFVPLEAGARIDAGFRGDFDNWAVAFALPREDAPVTNDEFVGRLVPEIKRSIAGLISDPGLRERVNSGSSRALSELATEMGAKEMKPTFDVGAMTLTGLYADKPHYVCYGISARMSFAMGNGAPMEVPAVATICMMNVRDRALAFGFYRMYKGDDDIASARSAALAWAEATVKLNP